MKLNDLLDSYLFVSSCASFNRRTGINGTRYASNLIKEHDRRPFVNLKTGEPITQPPRRNQAMVNSKKARTEKIRQQSLDVKRLSAQIRAVLDSGKK